MKKISNEALAVLSASTFQGNVMQLPAQQLERKLYTEVAAAIEACQGKWDRKTKTHIFSGDAADLMDDVIVTGGYRRVKQDLGQFDTPEWLALELVEHAEINPDEKVLEPSCGIGRIVAALRQLDTVGYGLRIAANEIDRGRYEACREAHFKERGTITNFDFLMTTPIAEFDRVVMNPPFARQADIDHVLHAFQFLKPGGVLVAIMSAGVTFRQDRKAEAFRDVMKSHQGEFLDVSERAFVSEGTEVRTTIVRMVK